MIAPLALIQLALPALRRRHGTIVDITSDAAVEGYDGWGGYGSSKAALEQLANVLAAEEPDVRVVLVRPRRHAHADAPGGVPRRGHLRPPAARRRSCPASSGCSDADAPSGRYRAADRGRGSDRRERRWPNASTFDLPPALEAGAPPEARGVRRDGVRLLVASRSAGELTHTTFDRIVRLPLDPATSSSSTRPAHPGRDRGDRAGRIGRRRPPVDPARRRPLGGRAAPRPTGPRRPGGPTTSSRSTWRSATTPASHLPRPVSRPARLWIATVRTPVPLLAWLDRHGRPIRYGYVEHAWPLSAYQNVYADEPGSAEMPSAGRPFSARGDHPPRRHGRRRRPARAAHRRRLAGVDRAAVPGAAAGAGDHGGAGQRTRAARRPRHRRRHDGGARLWRPPATIRRGRSPYDGWTDLVITPERGVRVVDGLLTGWHEPEASHLLMLEAVAGRRAARALLRGQPGRGLPVARVRRRAPDPAVIVR